jgi:anthranilate synthase/aminodeoxychorismate synthase-like glutamine amidotransferase
VLLIVDNYDSFTFNLVQGFQSLDVSTEVVRNDIPLASLLDRKPSRIVISPGPKRPADAGVSNDVLRELAGKLPILGVCLGHQCIGTVFGGRVARAKRIMHGKTSPIHHDGAGLFRDLPNPFQAMRYHSLIVEELPAGFEITARTDQNEIMGIRHEKWPLEGVQFHPESYRTDTGMQILENFLRL